MLMFCAQHLYANLFKNCLFLLLLFCILVWEQNKLDIEWKKYMINIVIRPGRYG